MIVKANIQPHTLNFWIYSQKQDRNTLHQDGAIPYSLEKVTYSLEKDNPSRVKEELSGSLTMEFSNTEINLAEKRVIEQLKGRDAEVRAHEHAHMSAAGGVATSGPTYIYMRGPDGRLYAVGGEVSIDSSPVPGNPEKTIEKAQKIRRAALAPVNPSGQDMRVAAAATRMEQQARTELAQEKREESDEKNNEIKVNSEDDENIIAREESPDTRQDDPGTRAAILYPRIEDIYTDQTAGASEESKRLVDLFV